MSKNVGQAQPQLQVKLSLKNELALFSFPLASWSPARLPSAQPSGQPSSHLSGDLKVRPPHLDMRILGPKLEEDLKWLGKCKVTKILWKMDEHLNFLGKMEADLNFKENGR